MKLIDALKKNAAKDGDLDRAVKLSQTLSCFQRSVNSSDASRLLMFP